MTRLRSSSSFRDPHGFVFFEDGDVYRQVNTAGRDSYDALVDSGLYGSLIEQNLVVRHEVVSHPPMEKDTSYRVLRVQRVPFISYPYEWCFSQLKDAALLTLSIQKIALEHGVSLKDSSAYNVQFIGTRPVFIDSLSFEAYREGTPWVAYRQFCQHFLAPLALMAHSDVRLGQLARVHVDGIPLDLASHLLPWGTKLRFGLLSHVHLHSSFVNRYSERTEKPKIGKTSRTGLLGILDSLESSVRGLTWSSEGTEWNDYYEDTNYTSQALQSKGHFVNTVLAATRPSRALDLGANTGLFSRLAARQGAYTIAADMDPGAVERNFLQERDNDSGDLLPLLIDLDNPSPSMGWNNQERASFVERQQADVVLALALVHHLAIGNNVPLDMMASFFASLGRHLIVEFVPKTDSQVRRLLVTREDVFDTYTERCFLDAFSRHYNVVDRLALPDSHRTLFHMERIGSGSAPVG